MPARHARCQRGHRETVPMNVFGPSAITMEEIPASNALMPPFTTTQTMIGSGQPLSVSTLRKNCVRNSARYCEGRQVLEVGCGAGSGLGYLGTRARRVVAGDYTHELLAMARSHYGPRFPLVRLDGEHLPFRERGFDVVLLYEAIYYLQDAGRFVDEARRVLRPRRGPCTRQASPGRRHRDQTSTRTDQPGPWPPLRPHRHRGPDRRHGLRVTRACGQVLANTFSPEFLFSLA